MFTLAVMVLLTLHTPDGREVDVSTNEVTSLHCRMPGAKNQNFADGVNAIINLTDGKFISVRETCGEVRDAITRAQQKGER